MSSFMTTDSFLGLIERTQKAEQIEAELIEEIKKKNYREQKALLEKLRREVRE